MLGHGSKFDNKKEQAIAALLSQRNVEEAARTVGISANTLLRWLKAPEFVAAYKEARREAFLESIARLRNSSGAAAMTVLRIMVDPNVSAGARLRAAEIVLSQAAKAIEIEDIEERVTELERAVSPANRSRKQSVILPWLHTKASVEPDTTPALISTSPRLPAAAHTKTDDDPDHPRPTNASGDHAFSAPEPSGEDPAVLTDRTTVDDKVE